jgi:hypothetical protein
MLDRAVWAAIACAAADVFLGFVLVLLPDFLEGIVLLLMLIANYEMKLGSVYYLSILLFSFQFFFTY